MRNIMADVRMTYIGQRSISRDVLSMTCLLLLLRECHLLISHSVTENDTARKSSSADPIRLWMP